MPKKFLFSLILQTFLIALFLLVGIFLYSKLIGPVSLSFNDQNPKRTFEVDGVGTVTATPNKIETQFNINETGATQKEAQQKGNDKQAKATDILISLGIAKKDIQTSGYYINPVFDYNMGTQILRGYSITINTSVKSDDISKINKVLDALPALGINVGGISYSIDNEAKYKDEARQKAVEAAKQKAQSLAKAANFRLGKIASIKELEQPDIRPIPLPVMKGASETQTSTTSIEPGSREITSHVSITYYIND